MFIRAPSLAQVGPFSSPECCGLNNTYTYWPPGTIKLNMFGKWQMLVFYGVPFFGVWKAPKDKGPFEV